jgi:hypothetical protein
MKGCGENYGQMGLIKEREQKKTNGEGLHGDTARKEWLITR